MGGRSRKVDAVDRWDWVSELSDYRLQQYGLMSKYNSNDGRDLSKTSLNWACSNEYESRYGKAPDWKI